MESAQNSCRPLIQLLMYPSQYLEVPYSYNESDIQCLSSYLTPNLKISGIDYQSQHPPSSPTKSKFRIVAREGRNVKDNEKLKFISLGELTTFDIQMQLVLPIINDPSLGDTMEQVVRAVSEGLIVVVSGSEKTIFEEARAGDLESKELKGMVKLDNDSKILKRKNLRTFMNCITVPVVMKKQETLTLNKLRRIISTDLSHCINIMEINQMFKRVIGRHRGVLPLQNYFKTRASYDTQFASLTQGSNAEEQRVEGKKADKGAKREGEKKKDEVPAHNTVFLLGIILVIVLYVYLKFKGAI